MNTSEYQSAFFFWKFEFYLHVCIPSSSCKKMEYRVYQFLRTGHQCTLKQSTRSMLLLYSVVSFMNAISFYCIKTWFLKLSKKMLNNISVAHNKAIKRICGCNSYYSCHECLKYDCLPNFKHFLVKKLLCSKTFHLKKPMSYDP